MIAGQEALWQLPEGPAKGLLFLAHGCSHSATDFWERSEACPNCLGGCCWAVWTGALLN